jgi:hypothetical protein
MVLAAPGPRLTPPPSSSPPKTPHRSYSAQASVFLSFSLSPNKICVQIKRDDESAQLFVDTQKELELLPSTIRSNSVPIESIRVESMSGGEVLGATLITWLKDTEETVQVARKVVDTV